MSNQPDLTKFRGAIFWDTAIEDIDFTAHCGYVINRIFERGNEEQILEIIRFYGIETIKKYCCPVKLLMTYNPCPKLNKTKLRALFY